MGIILVDEALTRQRESDRLFLLENGLMALTTLIAMVNVNSWSFLTMDALAQ